MSDKIEKYEGWIYREKKGKKAKTVGDVKPKVEEVRVIKRRNRQKMTDFLPTRRSGSCPYCKQSDEVDKEMLYSTCNRCKKTFFTKKLI